MKRIYGSLNPGLKFTNYQACDIRDAVINWWAGLIWKLMRRMGRNKMSRRLDESN